MIKEDYVSFETAKLLKEKGFDEECSYRYVAEPDYRTPEFVRSPIGKGSRYLYNAPTHQMAMKWLREVHNILITIIPQEIGLGFDKLCYGIYRITEDLYQPLYNGKLDNLVNSYEEAAEAGIKYCLKNLI